MSKPKTTPFPPEEMRQFLSEEDTGVLSLVSSDGPYAMPVSYAFLDGRIIIHCALKGRKLDIIREDPRAVFVVSRHPDRMKPHHPEGDCDYRYESVICKGQARIIEDLDERFRLLSDFKNFFYRRLQLPAEKNPVTQRAAEHCGCLVITIEEMTGRRKN